MNYKKERCLESVLNLSISIFGNRSAETCYRNSIIKSLNHASVERNMTLLNLKKFISELSFLEVNMIILFIRKNLINRKVQEVKSFSKQFSKQTHQEINIKFIEIKI